MIVVCWIDDLLHIYILCSMYSSLMSSFFLSNTLTFSKNFNQMNGNCKLITSSVSIVLITNRHTLLDRYKQKRTKNNNVMRWLAVQLTTQIIHVIIVLEMYLMMFNHIQSIMIALSLWMWNIA